jgi:diaminohydroxyphosphoribosylaminopyrimidine deaminase/5-amino-6-(5-phosphoribosylamino)uracil reductase
MPSGGDQFSGDDERFMRRALELAAKGFGGTAPNPMVGAVIVQNGKIIGEGWHKRAGEAHAEINAINAAKRRGAKLRGAVLYVTLEPCSTCGRTGPCTSAIIEAGIARVAAAAPDPNPRHRGRGFAVLRKNGVVAASGLLRRDAEQLNEAFRHWIVHRTPFIVLKTAMSLDGRIATNSGESKWITGPQARARGMRLRLGSDAILAGVNTIIRDDPALTLRREAGIKIPEWKCLKRVVLDPEGRTPPDARALVKGSTLVVLTSLAPAKAVRGLEKRAEVLIAPIVGKRVIDLHWLMKELGEREITSLLVEGGGETHAAFLAQKLGNRVCFFYAPLIIGGHAAARAVGGSEKREGEMAARLREPAWERIGNDFLLSALIEHPANHV